MFSCYVHEYAGELLRYICAHYLVSSSTYPWQGSRITLPWYSWFQHFWHLVLHFLAYFFQFHNPALHTLQICSELLVLIRYIKPSCIEHNLFTGTFFLILNYSIYWTTWWINEGFWLIYVFKQTFKLVLLRGKGFNSRPWGKFGVVSKMLALSDDNFSQFSA